jgi:hypothetical protein
MLYLFDKDKMRILVNRVNELTPIYMKKVAAYRNPENKTDQSAIDRALREVFEEYVANGTYGEQFGFAKRDYPDIPKETETYKEFQRLYNILGHRRLMYAMRDFAFIKVAEMKNGGFDDQATKWSKFGQAMQDFAKLDLMP